jgi:uncharacterized protein with FMN-binding domain
VEENVAISTVLANAVEPKINSANVNHEQTRGRKDISMKNFNILALVTALALGLTVSAQAQTEKTTGSDQYTTQSADQPTTRSADPTYSARTTSDNNSAFTQQTPQQSQSTSMSTSKHSDNRQFPSDELNSDQRLRELRNDSGAD